MDKKVNVISNIEHELEVKLSYDEITKDIEKYYKEEQKKIQLDGFRKGKVPMHLIKQMYGEAVEFQATEKISNDIFWKIVDEDDLKPISTPSLSDINFERGKELSFKVRYEVKPVLELKDYKNQEIEKVTFPIKDEDVENELIHILKHKATFEPAEKIEDTHYRIKADLQGLDEEGNAIPGAVSQNMQIDLSDEKVNSQIIENAVGKKVGETFNFEFVDEHGEGDHVHTHKYNYAGTITEIEKIVLPELSDDFIKTLTNNKSNNAEEYKAQLKENLTKYYGSQADSIYTNNLLNQIVKNNDFEAPKGYVNFLLNQMVKNENETAKRQGRPVADEKKLRESLVNQAIWNAKWQIIMENIVAVEGIKVEESDLLELAKDESVKYGIPEDKLLKYYKDNKRDEMLLEDKVIKFLKETNIAKEISFDDKEKNKNETSESTKTKKTKSKKSE